LVVDGGNAAARDSARHEIERLVPFASFASCVSLDGDIMTPSAPCVCKQIWAPRGFARRFYRREKRSLRFCARNDRR